ncbi:hypothetical protein [Variovorax sp. JS1663]|uniref:hypothetical protein n=1 Tax=Variovorax sp. JS1663 TaxID=1851577 RepID=UPI000B3459A7|nr:hypothetical protein [Variovorax sp. JS1663]OUM04049.1 hypothetical protein A8M77_03280 [Variovorax sp. JS1663]
MTVPLAASIIDLALGLALGASDPAAGNRCSLEGLALSSGPDGVVEIRASKLEAAALRLAVGPLVMELDRVAVHELVAGLRTEAGAMRLSVVEAAQVEFSGVKLHGPLVVPAAIRQVWDATRTSAGSASPAASAAPAAAWFLGPLGDAEGTVRGEITDAHLLFDADVTVPIRFGQVDFNDATVEHVGPDSRMGVSRMGFYVDAPNGRSYLYQFASAPLAGVEFERRGALLSPWVSERGKLRLQPFVESMLRLGSGGPGPGLTEQARLLLGRTALSGELQLGDGSLAMPGLQAHLEGRGEGRNAVTLHSQAVGRGLGVEMESVSARDAAARWMSARLACERVAARLKLQLLVEGPQLRFALELADGRLTRPRLELA